MFTHRFLGAALLLAGVLVPAGAGEARKDIKLTQRLRTPSKADAAKYEVVNREVAWDPAKTAMIICDVWDAHHCLNAVRREEEMLPRLCQVIDKARELGVLIIHAPSHCMDPYKDHPAR